MDFAAQINFEGGVFPWTTQLDMVTDDSIGTNLCGPISYQIVPVSYTESSYQPLVVQNETILKLQPSTEFAAGFYYLKLIGSLVQYPSIVAVQPFQVMVSDCSTRLSSAYVTAKIVVDNTWFIPDAGTSYQPILDQLVQTPQCGFGYKVELWSEPVPNDGLYGVPADIKMNTKLGLIYVEKCLDPTSDSVCV